MANNIEIKVWDDLKTTEFCLQVDETTLGSYVTQLKHDTSHLNNNRDFIEEFLFVEQDEIETKSLTIFKTVGNFYTERSFPLINVIWLCN